MTKYLAILFMICILTSDKLRSQDNDSKDIRALIDNYSKARENRDTVLLKKILTEDVDQLVSNGEWRSGLRAAIQGMLESSATNPGTRTLTVERVRYIDQNVAITDARYEIRNPDGTVRKMWSSFTVLRQKKEWKITAIRNMLPAGGK